MSKPLLFSEGGIAVKKSGIVINIMGTPEFNLNSAETPSGRMSELFRFMQFWMGPRKPEYGLSGEEVAGPVLPKSLLDLHVFAAHWPSYDDSYGGLEMFHTGHHLTDVETLKAEPNDKLEFVWTDQWCCSTLRQGNDPPVWVTGEVLDEDNQVIEGETLVTDSLSCFLVTFTLRAVFWASRRTFDANEFPHLEDRTRWQPLWVGGSYVEETHEFYLHEDFMIGRFYGKFFFASNDEHVIQRIESAKGT